MKHHTCRTLATILLAAVLLQGCGLFVHRLPSGEVPEPTPHDRFVAVEGVRLHYVEYPGPGPKVVLLHGFGSSSYSWAHVAPLLQAAGCHVYAPDMKGFGWSDKPEDGDYSPLALTEEVNDWMEVTGLEDVVFVGNSLGGAVGVLLAIRHPERIDRLVLVDAAGYPMKMPGIVRLARVPGAGPAVHLAFGRWLVARILREVYFHEEWVTDEQVQAYYDRLRTRNALGAMVSLARSVDFEAFEKYLDPLRTLPVETLLLWGREDTWVPLEIGYRYRADLPRSTLMVIPECGHVPQEEYPEVTAHAILDFIEGRPIEESPLPRSTRAEGD